MNWIEKGWYGHHKQTYWLLPLTVLFFVIGVVRRALFKLGLLKVNHFELPVIVVGNITVGGTGKTPFVLHLVELLKRMGYSPAIVSRGYGASKSGPDFPRLVTRESSIEESGDEPKLLAMRSGCPVVIAPQRSEAVRYIIEKTSADIVIADDGLQHYAMDRDVEIVLLDAERLFGNGWLLPVGPMRESPSRLNNVDLVVKNQGNDAEGAYHLVPGDIYTVESSEPVVLEKGAKVHLVSGIGNPNRFEKTVADLNLDIKSTTWFPDHHAFTKEDFAQIKLKENEYLLMTEKDAVKCQSLANDKWLVLPISANISASLEAELVSIINKKCKKST